MHHQKPEPQKHQLQVSRTELKKSHERLQALSLQLAALAPKKWQSLPVSDYFLDELKALATIKSAAAKNRQIKRVGKLMVEEDRHALVDALFELTFDATKSAKILSWHDRLTIADDNTLKQFVRTFNASEFNTLNQLLLWIDHAKTVGDLELLAESDRDFLSYIKEVALLSA